MAVIDLQIFDSVDSNPEDIKLIILDICNLDIEKNSYYADFIRKIGKQDKTRILCYQQPKLKV